MPLQRQAARHLVLRENRLSDIARTVALSPSDTQSSTKDRGLGEVFSTDYFALTCAQICIKSVIRYLTHMADALWGSEEMTRVYAMAKADLGVKRTCTSCSMKFYDFNRSPIACPGCGAAFDPEAAITSRKGRASAKAPLVEEPPVETAVTDEDGGPSADIGTESVADELQADTGISFANTDDDDDAAGGILQDNIDDDEALLSDMTPEADS